MGRRTVPENSPAIKYGRRMVAPAREAYLSKMKSHGHRLLNVCDTGLHVMPDVPFIGASPDGLVTCPCNYCLPGNGLLVIKCPLSRADKDPMEAPPAYLVKESGHLHLSQSHPYYVQVQFQMLVCGSSWCDFCVFTKSGEYVERIRASPQWQQELLLAAKKVFAHLVLPELCASGELVLYTFIVPTLLRLQCINN